MPNPDQKGDPGYERWGGEGGEWMGHGKNIYGGHGRMTLLVSLS